MTSKFHSIFSPKAKIAAVLISLLLTSNALAARACCILIDVQVYFDSQVGAWRVVEVYQCQPSFCAPAP